MAQANFDVSTGSPPINSTLLIGGTHGNEPATVRVLEDFLQSSAWMALAISNDGSAAGQCRRRRTRDALNSWRRPESAKLAVQLARGLRGAARSRGLVRTGKRGLAGLHSRVAAREDCQPALGARRDRCRWCAIDRAGAGDVGLAGRLVTPAVPAACHRTRPRPAETRAPVCRVSGFTWAVVWLRARVSRRLGSGDDYARVALRSGSGLWMPLPTIISKRCASFGNATPQGICGESSRACKRCSPPPSAFRHTPERMIQISVEYQGGARGHARPFEEQGHHRCAGRQPRQG